MIRGYSSSLKMWLFQVPDFSKEFKVVMFDNRGAGETDKPDIPYSIRMFAEDTIGLMDALEIDTAHILGISMGGMIAQEIALNYSERVKKLILCATTVGAKGISASPEIVSKLVRDPDMSEEEFYRRMVPVITTKEILEKKKDLVEKVFKMYVENAAPEHANRRQIEAIMFFDSYDLIPRINAPTLVLQGKDDVLIPPDNARILAGRIPNAKLVFIKGGHLCNMEYPKEFNREVINFLKGT
ncbi:MAG: alpha/beta fold hydrolase [Candidatus Lokiarchaeia archaeon]